jgi:tetratricopeptide (TPR) repeat protein
MRCPRCDTDTPEGAKFCIECGTPLRARCPQCGADVLPPASAEELLRALAGEDASLAPLKRLLIMRTAGNPFFLEESVRTLLETQALVGERGVYRLGQPLQSIQVPASVQVVLATRIDRLPPEEKRLLQTASVIGTEVPFALLQAIAEVPEEGLHRGLTHLKAAEFLYETRLFPEPEYTFGDFSRAAELRRRNVEAADRESGTPRTDVRIQSQSWLVRTLGALGAFAEGRRHGEEVLRLATLAGRGAIPTIVLRNLGDLYLAQGDLEAAIRAFDEGLALCRASGNRTELRGMASGLGYASALQGRVAEGRALLEEAIGEEIHTGRRQSSLAVAWLSEVCHLAGCGEEAWQHAHQALALARQQKARGEEAIVLYQLGVIQAHADPLDAEQAETHYQEALALAEELGMRPLVAHCHHGLGALYAVIGHQELARAELSVAIELFHAMEMTFWLPEAEAALAQVEKP